MAMRYFSSLALSVDDGDAFFFSSQSIRIEGVKLSSNCPLLIAQMKAARKPVATNRLMMIKIKIALTILLNMFKIKIRIARLNRAHRKR
jgi:hypothetical protein